MNFEIHPLYQALLGNFKANDEMLHQYDKKLGIVHSHPIEENQAYINTNAEPLTTLDSFKINFACEVQNHCRHIVEFVWKQRSAKKTDIDSDLVLESIQLLVGTAVLPDAKNPVRGIEELMGDIKYAIVVAPPGRDFILPDTSAGMQRSFIMSWTDEGHLYSSIDQRLVQVLVPISSNVMLMALSRRSMFRTHAIQPHSILETDNELMDYYNETILNTAVREVACTNVHYLKTFLH